jgi:hypothetical protein
LHPPAAIPPPGSSGARDPEGIVTGIAVTTSMATCLNMARYSLWRRYRPAQRSSPAFLLFYNASFLPAMAPGLNTLQTHIFQLSAWARLRSSNGLPQSCPREKAHTTAMNR